MTERLELDIHVFLPEVPDDGDTPAKLCIHFDGEKLPLSRVRDMVQAAGA